jgi:outer membrane autotransporter protein
MVWAGVSIIPSAGIQLASVSTGALDESAHVAAFAVRGDASQGTSVRPYLRLAVAKSFFTASQIVITPQASLGVSYEAGNPGREVAVVANGATFGAKAAALGAASGQMMAGITASRGNWSVTARYTAQVSGDWSSQTVEAGVQVKF